ncbi:MAG: DUF4010 domain-containing protein [Myxococcota bacterium]
MPLAARRAIASGERRPPTAGIFARSMASEWANFSVALGIGLLIGLERERSKGEGPARGSAGIRTFALASVSGALALHVGGVLLLAVVMGAGAVLIGLSYARTRETDPGLTTEIGLSLVPLLGALAMSEPGLAAGLAVVVAVVFAAKVPLHGLVKRTLSDAEVRDGLVFAIATLVIWPLLPDRPLGPYGAINPHRVWLVVILVLAIGAAGHVALRLLGRGPALPLVGLAAGFVSSTAAIGSMAGRAAQDPASLPAAVAGSALSTVATFVQMAILLSSVSPATLLALAPMLATGGIVAAGFALVFALRSSASEAASAAAAGRAFSWPAALGLAALLVVVSIATAALQARLGAAGLIAGATIAGFVDAHAAGVSVASLVASNALAPGESVAPILAVMTSNAIAKIAVAVGVGSGAFARGVVSVVVVSMAAAWLVAWLTILR